MRGKVFILAPGFALLLAGLWIACSRDNTVVPVDRTPVVEGDAGAALFEWAIGPIEGITTAWHPAPPEITVPVGTTLRLKCGGSPSAGIHWSNAEEVSRGELGSIAECRIDSPGRHEISVTVVAGRTWQERIQEDPGDAVDGEDGHHLSLIRTCIVNCVEVGVDHVGVLALAPRVAPFTITESSSNYEAMKAFRIGDTISQFRQVGPNHYRTAVNRPMELDATLSDPRFTSVIEARITGERPVLLANFTGQIREAGRYTISVGPPSAAREIVLDTYAVSITSHVTHRDVIQDYHVVTFTAETDPPGHEDEITWLACTKYGSVTPVLGSGGTFTAAWKGTFDQDAPSNFFSQWIGVAADNARFSQDQSMSVTYGVRVEQGVYRAYIESEAQPLIDVVFNPVTEVEDLTTLRFFGYDQAQLTALENIGPASLILDSRTILAAALWQGSFPGFVGTSGQRAILSKISQGLRMLQDMCGAANFLANPSAPRPWVPNGCTGVDDLNCKSCCDDHDECYCLHTLTRKGCDDAFLAWMVAQPPPCFDVAPTYYAGVRALGWLFY